MRYQHSAAPPVKPIKSRLFDDAGVKYSERLDAALEDTSSRICYLATELLKSDGFGARADPGGILFQSKPKSADPDQHHSLRDTVGTPDNSMPRSDGALGARRVWKQEREDVMPDHVPQNARRSSPRPRSVPPLSFEWEFAYSGYSNNASPVMFDSRTVLFPYNLPDKTGSRVVGNLSAIDMKSSTIRWTALGGDGFYATPCIGGSVCYVGCDDRHLYAIDVSNGNVLWTIHVGGKVWAQAAVSGNLLFVGDANGVFHAIDTVNKRLVWSQLCQPCQPNNTRFSRALVDGNAVIVACAVVSGPSVTAAGIVRAFDINTGNVLWTYQAGAPTTSNLAIGDGLVYVGCEDGSFHAIDRQNGTGVWRFTCGGPVWGDPAFDSGWIYWGASDGSFYAHVSHPQSMHESAWVLPVNWDIHTGVLVYEGCAYLGARDEHGSGYFYEIDLQSAQQGTPQALTEGLDGMMLFTPSIADGMIAFVEQGFFGGTIVAISLSSLLATPRKKRTVPQTDPEPLPQNMLRQVSFSSKMMVHDYTVADGSATPTKPAYHMRFSMTDDNGVPRAFENVSIWAAQPTTVTIKGAAVSLGADRASAITVAADARGQVALTADAGVTLPNLLFSPDYFGNRFVTGFPDVGNLQRLMGVQGADLDRSVAKSFDGKPILAANRQDAQSRDSIAATIRNAIGRQDNRPTLRAGEYPGQFVPGEIANWVVRLTDSAFIFQAQTDDEARQLFLGEGGIATTPASALGDFLDFLANVVHGAEAVAEVVWTWVGNGVRVLVTGVEQAYQFMVTTIDQAVQVLTGIVKQVVESVEKFVEWLSYLFDWNDIVKTHKLISEKATAAANVVKTWLDTEIENVEKSVDGWFKAQEDQIGAMFDHMIALLSGSTVANLQAQYGKASAILTPNGQDIQPQSMWLMDKYQSSAATMPKLGLTADDFTAEIQAFIDAVKHKIAGDMALQKLPGDLQTAISDLEAMCSQGDGLSNRTAGDLLALVRDASIALLELADNIVDLFLEMVKSVLDRIITFLTAPIDIPFLSDFYQSVAGSTLSIVDLVALIVAVPVTLIMKLTKSTRVAGSDDWVPMVMLGAAIAQLFLMLFWAIGDVQDAMPAPLMGIIAAATFLFWALQLDITISTMTSAPNQYDYLMFVAQAFPVLLGCLLARIETPEGAPNVIYAAYGGFMFVLYTLYSILFKDTWGSDTKRICANFFGVAPYAGQPLAFIPDVGKWLVVLVDLAGYGVSSGILAYEAAATA